MKPLREKEMDKQFMTSLPYDLEDGQELLNTIKLRLDLFLARQDMVGLSNTAKLLYESLFLLTIVF